MLNEIKKVLGLNNDEFNDLISNYILSAKADLKSVGIASSKLIDGSEDPTVKVAIQTYVQSLFDVVNSEKLNAAYELQKDNMRKKAEYLEGA